MPLVTLTTDWGNSDYYLASFKGLLASQCPDVRVIDITNDVDHFDILQASFVLKNCYDKFPPGTIHFIGVRGHETKQKSSGYLLVESNGHFFIGFDNGIFSLTLESADKKVFLPDIDASAPSYEITQQIIQIIAMLVLGRSPETFCKHGAEFISVINSSPSFDQDTIRGSIIYIDSFQNIISNITKKLFLEQAASRSFSIIVRNHECRFRKVHTHYSDADTGEPVCMFNEKGLLELALSGANAAGLLGVKVLDNIRIEFHGAIPLPKQEYLSPRSANEVT